MSNSEGMCVSDGRQRTHEMLVYFIGCNDEFVKIGIAYDPAGRLSQFQPGCPYDLLIMAAVPGGRRYELALHKEFRDERIRGEWFRLSPRLRKHIETAVQRLAKEDGL